jgi:sulfofructose kinase
MTSTRSFRWPQLKRHGVPVVADLIPSETSAELLKMVDVLIAPRHFTSRVGCEDDLDAALDHIHELGPTTAVITLGSDGWVYSAPGERGRGAAFKVDVVDTTGAGDTFHGAFAYGLASHWDTRQCAEFASAVAAISCTAAGGRTGLPTMEQTVALLRTRNTTDWAW